MNKPLNKSLQKKRVARMAAVQALYSHAINPAKINIPAMVAHMVAHWKDSLDSQEPDLAMDIAPDSALLERIVRCAIEQEAHIEEQIDNLILPGWRKERMSPVLMCNLRAFAAELIARPDTQVAVLIGEYTDVAASFVSEQELSFIHSALNHVANGLRTSTS